MADLNSDQESDDVDNSDQESEEENSSELAQEERDLKSKDSTVREKALQRRLNRVIKQNQRFRAERRSNNANNNSSSQESSNSNDNNQLPAGVTDRLAKASFVAQSNGLVDADLIYTTAKSYGLLKLDDNFEVTNYKDVIRELRQRHPSLFAKGNIGGGSGNNTDNKPQTMDQIIRGLSGRRT